MSAPSIRLIQDAVCDHYGVTSAALLRGGDGASMARAVAIALASRLTDRLDHEVGRAFAGDYSIVGEAVDRVDQAADADPAFAAEIAGLVAGIGAAAITLARHGGGLADIDPVAVAEDVLASPRAAAGVSIDEVRALAAAVLAGRKTTTSNEETRDA